MAPRKSKSIGMPKKNRKNQIKKISKRSAKSRFFKMADDPFSMRFRGCTLVQTELPKIMQPRQRTSIAFRFRTAFLSATHLYGFYYEGYETRMLLARFCLFSQTWEKIRSFQLNVPDRSGFLVLPLPWSPNTRQVLLFHANHCVLLEFSPSNPEAPPPPSRTAAIETTMTEIDLMSMLALPEDDIVINVEMAIYTTWLQVVADRENRVIYALVEVGAGAYSTKDLAIFRLDWTSRLWTRLTVMETPQQRLERGEFLAFRENYLYLGLVRKGRIAMSSCWSVDESNSLIEVQRVNINTGTLDRWTVTGRPHPAIINRQSNLEFCQAGDTVYVMSTILGPTPLDNRLRVVRNQLYALNLYTMHMKQINDGPQGTLPQIQLPTPPPPPSAAASAEMKDPCANRQTSSSTYFYPYGYNRAATAESRALAVVCTPPANPNSRGNTTASACALPTYITSSPTFLNPAEESILMYGMRYFSLVTYDGSELWALNQARIFHDMPPIIKLFRITMQQMPTLASMALDLVLLRAPVNGLCVPPSDARTRGHVRRQRVKRSERTLPYLRAWAKRTELRPFIENYLPDEERWEEEPVSEMTE